MPIIFDRFLLHSLCLSLKRGRETLDEPLQLRAMHENQRKKAIHSTAKIASPGYLCLLSGGPSFVLSSLALFGSISFSDTHHLL
mmetsp:Transcript_29033/g.67342  ORF Transcript_29033/g.67342 Transcript_29033/m.67342 type:complete len:84 (+) Transcript_29033:9-260(+)